MIKNEFKKKLENELNKLDKENLNIIKLCIKKFLEYRKKDIFSVRDNDVKEFLDLVKSKYDLKTYNSYKTSLQIILKSLNKSENLVIINEWKEIKKTKKKYNHKLPDFLDKNEYNLLLESITNYKHKNIIEFWYNTWLKISEICDIEISDIDLTKDKIYIKKNNIISRIVDIDKDYKNTIIKYINKNRDNFYLFESNKWWKLTPRSLQKIFKKWIAIVKTDKDLSFQSLRHTYAINKINNWTAIEKLQELLGHTNIRNTKIYCKYIN